MSMSKRVKLSKPRRRIRHSTRVRLEDTYIKSVIRSYNKEEEEGTLELISFDEFLKEVGISKESLTS